MLYDEEYYETQKILYKYRYFTDIIYSISNKSKYSQYYVDLCENILYKNFINKNDAKEKTNTYIETHHILPRSVNINFEKSKNNLLYCTAREHFILHKLLSKMFIGKDEQIHRKMLKAVTIFKMKNKSQERIFSSRDYEYIRKCLSESVTGKMNPSFGKDGTVKGKKCYTNGTINKFFKEGEQLEGFYLGSKTKGKFKTINNGTYNVKISIHEEIPDSFKLGSMNKGKESSLKGTKKETPVLDETRLKISTAILNKIWITNGTDDLRIHINSDIPDGWVKGRVNGVSFTEKIVCNICNSYISNKGNVAKHRKKCNG